MISSTQTQHPLMPVSETPLDAGALASAEQACAQLKKMGVRVTKPRLAILSALFSEKEPIAIDTLHKERGLQQYDLVSLYRGLTLFADLGLVRRTLSFNGTSLYELNLGRSLRFRVTCTQSQKRELLSVDVSAHLSDAVQQARSELESKGFRDISFQIEFFAVSPDGRRISETSSERK